MSTRTPARTTIAALPPQPQEMRRGRCVTHPEPGLWANRAAEGYAVALCRGCPALQPCLAWSLTLPPGDKLVWGGLTPADRAALRRERQATARPPAA